MGTDIALDPSLVDLLQCCHIDFNWDDESCTWWLKGPTYSNRTWQSDYKRAVDMQEAQKAAIAYIKTFI